MCLQQYINFSVKVFSLCFSFVTPSLRQFVTKTHLTEQLPWLISRFFSSCLRPLFGLLCCTLTLIAASPANATRAKQFPQVPQDTLTLAILAVIAPNLICLSNSICFASLEDWSKHVLSAETVSPPPSSLIVTTSTAALWLETSQLLAQSAWVCSLCVNI